MKNIPALCRNFISLAFMIIGCEQCAFVQEMPGERHIQKENRVITNENLPDYNKLLIEAFALQTECDSLIRMAEVMRKEAVKSDNMVEKEARVKTIELLTTESDRLQSLAEEKFRKAEEIKSTENKGGAVQYSGHSGYQGLKNKLTNPEMEGNQETQTVSGGGMFGFQLKTNHPIMLKIPFRNAGYLMG